jgi:hypothetical protein
MSGTEVSRGCSDMGESIVVAVTPNWNGKAGALENLQRRDASSASPRSSIGCKGIGRRIAPTIYKEQE